MHIQRGWAEISKRITVQVVIDRHFRFSHSLWFIGERIFETTGCIVLERKTEAVLPSTGLVRVEPHLRLLTYDLRGCAGLHTYLQEFVKYSSKA